MPRQEACCTGYHIHLNNGAITATIHEYSAFKELHLVFGPNTHGDHGCALAPSINIMLSGGDEQRASLLLLSAACINLAQMFEEDEREAFAAHIQATDVPVGLCECCGDPTTAGALCPTCEAFAAGEAFA